MFTYSKSAIILVKGMNNGEENISTSHIKPCTSDSTTPRVAPKGVGPDTTLAWAGWKQPDIPVEVDTYRLETSRTEGGVLKKLSLAVTAKLSRLKYS